MKTIEIAETIVAALRDQHREEVDKDLSRFTFEELREICHLAEDAKKFGRLDEEDWKLVWSCTSDVQTWNKAPLSHRYAVVLIVERLTTIAESIVKTMKRMEGK